ncbi:MAG: hypothetical protein KatS3mg019_1051 [Fimbriimonadales bacterium]|nr:MAG: hypothetical protein KatS3mg019_0006 [Fimbriimonadales bacterium]GIV08960.1 MAG: hypothetical protein KatS3mg019_1051 [Fimbriimonadales bacterium]
MRTGQRSTTRMALIVLGVLLALYLGNIGVGYYQTSRMQLSPLEPTQFTIFGFPARAMEEKRWKILITHEVPKVVEVLREAGFERPEFGAEDQQNFKRVPIAEVVKTLPVVLTEQHIERVWVQERAAETLRAQGRFFVVHLELSDEGRARLWNYAREQVAQFRALGEKPRDERLLLMVDNQPWAAPMISPEVGSSWWLMSRFSMLQSSDVQIFPIYDEEIANIIAQGFEDAKQKASARGGTP